MALAAGWGAVLVWHRTTPIARIVLTVLLAIGAARVTSFDKAIDYTVYDLRAWTGALTREQYLSRFGERALATNIRRWRFTSSRTICARDARDQRVLLFGFSPGALVQSQRVSATRFFWSRPVIVGFNEGTPGYGVSGLLDDVQRHRPIEVILQQHDWDPDVLILTFFLDQPRLADWLRTHYEPSGELGNFLLYRRIARSSAQVEVHGVGHDCLNGLTVEQRRRIRCREVPGSRRDRAPVRGCGPSPHCSRIPCG